MYWNWKHLKLDPEDILHDQNNIKESTRAQLDAISTVLVELQAKEPRPASSSQDRFRDGRISGDFAVDRKGACKEKKNLTL